MGWGNRLALTLNPARCRYELTREVLPGSYPFKFVIDGKHWTFNADLPRFTGGGLGTPRSFMVHPAIPRSPCMVQSLSPSIPRRAWCIPQSPVSLPTQSIHPSLNPPCAVHLELVRPPADDGGNTNN